MDAGPAPAGIHAGIAFPASIAVTTAAGCASITTKLEKAQSAVKVIFVHAIRKAVKSQPTSTKIQLGLTLAGKYIDLSGIRVPSGFFSKNLF